MRLTTLLRTTASAAVVGAVTFGFAGIASAQETSVDDIIVTAQKREQNLQDVPIVVTTLSQETLEDAGVSDIKDLQILTPGMTVTSTSSETSTTARIRGVGTVGDNPGLESSVGVVIDGVPPRRRRRRHRRRPAHRDRRRQQELLDRPWPAAVAAQRHGLVPLHRRLHPA